MIVDVTKWLRANAWAGVRQGIVLLSWTVVYVTLLLAAFAGIIRLASGWDTVVVTSESMSPTLHVGDLLFIEDPTEELVGQQSVITFDRAGDGSDLVTHRVFETRITDQAYVTKGDANPSPDADLVRRDQVVGIGRLVVPFLGLPVIWISEQDVVALASLGVLAIAALTAVIVSALRSRDSRSESGSGFSSSAQQGISRVRLVVGLMIAMQFVVDGRQFEFGLFGLSRVQTLASALVALALISALASYRAHFSTGRTARRIALVELIGDTMVVAFFVAATGTAGIGWILMVLPVIEAAMHFRLTGAFVHWMVMCGITVAAFFWTSVRAGMPRSSLITDLERLVDRLGVLLLVVIPASYLAEQLLGEVFRQRRATQIARQRSRIIERVTAAGHDVTRLGGELFEALMQATLDLGFDVADVWVGDPERGWRLLASGGETVATLPRPGMPGSALRTGDLADPEVAIDADDPDPAEYQQLADAGIEVLVRITLVTSSDGYVVLRAGATALNDDPASQVMALRLLGGQAAVALQNEQLMSQLRSTYAELEHQAMYDALTGLANRAHFVTRLSGALRDEPSLPPILLFLDLNGFKAVNDRLGHNLGDDLLVGVGERLVAAVAGRGLVARLGGDEFTVLLEPGCESYVAEEIADAVHLALYEPFELRGEHVRVGCAIGIAQGQPGIGVSETLRRADVAMYAAKATPGHWRTCAYRPDLDADERRHGRLARAFKSALDEGRLHLAYQPVVDAGTGAIAGFEALLRWTHDELGPVAPPLILEIAELTGHADQLNAWILETALSDVSSCELPGGREMFVAVNVSPIELQLESLANNMRRALELANLPASRVIVELSEPLVAAARGSVENLDRLTAMGLRLALDDFGEGQTSLAHLRGLPISFLKLDRLFVEHAGESPEDRKILVSVVNLAHELGFDVIAEGIETSDQHRIVTAAGADLLQGFGIHRPMRIREVRRLLADQRPEGHGNAMMPQPTHVPPLIDPVAAQVLVTRTPSTGGDG